MLVRQLMQIASEQVELWITAHTHGQQHQVSSLLCSRGCRAAIHQIFITKVCWLFSAMFKPWGMLDLQLQKKMRRLIILAESPATSENKLSLFPSDLNLREPLRVPKLWFYHLFASQSTWWQISPSNWRVTFLGDLLVFTHLRCPDVCLAATRPSLQRCLALSAERLSRATRQPPDQAWRFFGELLRKPFPVWVILQPESTWQKGNVNVTLNIRKQQSTWMPNAFLPAAANSFIPRANAVVDLLDKVFPSRSHVQRWQQQCAVIPSAQKYGLLQISFSSLQLSMSRSWKAHSEYGLISGWNFSPSAFEERLTQIWNGLLRNSNCLL